MNERGIRAIAKLAHQGQKYGDEDYYEAHVRPLVEMIRNAGGKQHAIFTAYLHDVVEDSWLTLDDLMSMGIDMDVIYAVKAITRNPDEKYADYIKRVNTNKFATQVKILDLRLNLSNSPNPSLIKRYEDALEFLNGNV